MLKEGWRPPTVLGVGAKKCGTIAFATFMKVNPEFKVHRRVEAHFLYNNESWLGGMREYVKKLPISNETDVVYEGTPRYLIESVVPERAKQIDPKYDAELDNQFSISF